MHFIRAYEGIGTNIAIHIGVGSALLVLTTMGNAKASRRGTSDRYRLTSFILSNIILNRNHGNEPFLTEQEVCYVGLIRTSQILFQ